MRRLLDRRLPVPVLTGIVLLFACGLALAKGHHKGPSCTARKGTTVLETRQVRVYRLHRAKHPGDLKLYACRRGTRASHVLPFGRDEHNRTSYVNFIYQGHLLAAGPYVAWEQMRDDSESLHQQVYVLDTRTGQYNEVYEVMYDIGQRIPDFVLNTRGTVVYVAAVHPDVLIAWSHGHHRWLDEGPPGGITSLALSKSGHQVYYLNNGKPKTAQIP